jgi:hypothetical protein
MGKKTKQTEDVALWQVSDVVQWLKSKPRLSRYADTFKENEIKGSDLPDLEDGDLKDYGIPKLGRRRLLEQVSELLPLASGKLKSPGVGAGVGAPAKQSGVPLPPGKKYHFFCTLQTNITIL